VEDKIATGFWKNSPRRAFSQCADRAQKERTLLSSRIEEVSKEQDLHRVVEYPAGSTKSA
jgi:hypothetical protein